MIYNQIAISGSSDVFQFGVTEFQSKMILSVDLKLIKTCST